MKDKECGEMVSHSTILPKTIRIKLVDIITYMKDLPFKMKQSEAYDSMMDLLNSYLSVNGLILGIEISSFKSCWIYKDNEYLIKFSQDLFPTFQEINESTTGVRISSKASFEYPSVEKKGFHSIVRARNTKEAIIFTDKDNKYCLYQSKDQFLMMNLYMKDTKIR